MDIIIEIFMEVLFECYLYACAAISSKFFPEKRIPKGIETLMKVLMIALTLALFATPFIGIGLLVYTKGESILGWVFLALGLLNILGGIILTIRKHFKE